jgi:hypothetical protein
MANQLDGHFELHFVGHRRLGGLEVFAAVGARGAGQWMAFGMCGQIFRDFAAAVVVAARFGRPPGRQLGAIDFIAAGPGWTTVIVQGQCRSQLLNFGLISPRSGSELGPQVGHFLLVAEPFSRQLFREARDLSAVGHANGFSQLGFQVRDMLPAFPPLTPQLGFGPLQLAPAACQLVVPLRLIEGPKHAAH